VTPEAPFDSVNSEVAILSRLIEPDRSALTPEAARFLLELRFQDADLRRMNELAEKAQDGILSPVEEKEIENYRHVGHLLALLRSKARASLKKRDFPGAPH
jgi:hypothetical protein